MKEKLNILMLVEFFYPFDRGGSEWSTYYLAKSLVEDKHAVCIVTPNFGSFKEPKYQGVDIYRFPFYKKIKNKYSSISPVYFSNIFWWIWTSLVIVYLIFRKKPDLLHIQGKYFIPAAITMGKLLGIPTLVTLRDYIPLCPHALCLQKNFVACNFSEFVQWEIPQYFANYVLSKNILTKIYTYMSSMRGWMTSKFIKFFLNQADKKVAISNAVAQIYQKNGISINTVIYNSIERKIIKTSRSKNYFLFVGRLTTGKGIDLLVDAYASLDKNNKFPKLLIIGTGLLQNWIKQHTGNGTIYLGQQEYGKTQDFIAHAKSVVIPSVWPEPFGRVALEALNAGVPVIATKRGALPEIINKDAGILIEPGIDNLQKALKQMISIHTRLRKEIKKNRTPFEQRFEVQPYKQYLEIYKRLLV